MGVKVRVRTHEAWLRLETSAMPTQYEPIFVRDGRVVASSTLTQ